MIEILPNFHPVLVHFTVALFSVATALFALLALVGQRLPESLCQQLSTVARWNLWFGAVASILTVLAGFHAYNTVAHDAPSHAAMTDHRNWAMGTLILFLLLAVWSIICARAARPLGTAFIVVLLVAQLVLLSTGWRGGELVYRYGLGVLSLPATEAGEDGHGHATAANAAHDCAMGSAESMSMENAAIPIESGMHSDAPHGYDDSDDHSHAPAINAGHEAAMPGAMSGSESMPINSSESHMDTTEHSDQPHGH